MSDRAREFEAEYRRLRESGSAGWGGRSYERRLTGWQATLDRVGPELGLNIGPMKILEVGCGNGMVAQQLSEKGHNVSGIDLSGLAIEWAVMRYALLGLNGSFHVGNACDMNCFADETFDVVIDGNCFHCIVGSARSEFLTEVFRILKAGGRFLVSSMCGPPRSVSAGVSYNSALQCLIRNDAPWRFIPSAEFLTEECQAFGFELARVDLNQNSWWNHLTMVLRRPVQNGSTLSSSV